MIERLKNIFNPKEDLESVYNKTRSKVQLPTIEQIDMWLNSKEGEATAEDLCCINGVGHAIFKPFNLKESHIINITHGVYLPERDLLVLADPKRVFEERPIALESELKKRNIELDIRSHFLIGTLATIKSNGWKIFDTLDPSYRPEGPAISLSRSGLQKRGIILFARKPSKDDIYPYLRSKPIPII